MLLVRAADAPEDLDRRVGIRFVHADRLEASLQRGVALDVLAVVIKRRRAHRLDLAPGQRWLEDVRCIDRAFGRACPDEHVDLVDEEDAILGGLNLLDHFLQALFELAAVLRACDQQADVEGEHAPAQQRVWHVARDDAVREPFGDSRLAYAGLADQHRVVLGAPGEDLNHTLDLGITADDGVELLVARHRRQVDTELVERRRARLPRARAGGLLLRLCLSEDTRGLAAYPFQIHAQALQHTGGDAFAFANETQKHVLRADVGVAQPSRFVDGEFDHFLRARREADLTAALTVAATDDELDRRTDFVQLHSEVGEHLGGDAVAFADQPEQQMLGADVVVVEALSLFLSQRQDTARPFRELVEAVSHSGLHPPPQSRLPHAFSDGRATAGSAEKASASRPPRCARAVAARTDHRASRAVDQ